MYNDYPIVKETVINNYTLLIILIVIGLSIFLFYTMTLYFIFKKGKRNPWLSFVPFLNLHTLIEIADIKRIHSVLIYIPIINLITLGKLAKQLSIEFGENKKFRNLLFFLPLIYYPVLGFSKRIKYIGINNIDVKEIHLDEKIIEQVESTDAKVVERNTDVRLGTSKNKTLTSDDGLVLDTGLLNSSIKVTNDDYFECPNCHNRVKKGVSVCFFCGANLKDINNNDN